jgi:hypothetical protein
MNSNETRPTQFTETLPTALPYLPPLPRSVPSEHDPILEPTAVASHQQLEAEAAGRPSRTRIAIAFFTLGLSIPFIGIRRKHTTRSYE